MKCVISNVKCCSPGGLKELTEPGKTMAYTFFTLIAIKLKG